MTHTYECEKEMILNVIRPGMSHKEKTVTFTTSKDFTPKITGVAPNKQSAGDYNDTSCMVF